MRPLLMSSVSIMAIFGSCIRSESAKSDKRQLIVSTVAANGRDAPLSAVRTRRARALDPRGRRQSSARVLLAARLIVSKPRPPRVLADYDEEFGYIVLGTHDVDVARTMLYAHLDRPERQRYLWSDWTAEQVVNACGTPYLVWIRQTFGYEGYRWQVQHTEPHARGASRAVEWRHR